jgi:hypothetical protein
VEAAEAASLRHKDVGNTHMRVLRPHAAISAYTLSLAKARSAAALANRSLAHLRAAKVGEASGNPADELRQAQKCGDCATSNGCAAGGHYAAALSDAADCLAIDAGNLKALFRRGLALRGLGRLADARAALADVVARDAANVQARQELAEMEAEEAAKRAAAARGTPETWIREREGEDVEIEQVSAAQLEALVTRAAREGAREAAAAAASAAAASAAGGGGGGASAAAIVDDGAAPAKGTVQIKEVSEPKKESAPAAADSTAASSDAGWEKLSEGPRGDAASSVDGFDMIRERQDDPPTAKPAPKQAAAPRPAATTTTAGDKNPVPRVSTTQTPPASKAVSPKAADDGTLPPMPTTAAMFEADWRQLRGDPHRFWRYLARLDPTGLRAMLKESLTADMLASVGDAACDGHLAAGGDPAPVVALLAGFAEVRRFAMVTMFFGKPEKERFARVFDAIIAAAGAGGDEQTLAKLKAKFC